MKYMGKRTDTFWWLEILLPQTLSLKAKSYAAGRANNIELLMLVSDFKVNSRLKNTQRIFSGIHGMPLMRMCRKNDSLPYIRGSHAILATSPKLLDIKSEVHRSGGDLIETNN